MLLLSFGLERVSGKAKTASLSRNDFLTDLLDLHLTDVTGNEQAQADGRSNLADGQNEHQQNAEVHQIHAQRGHDGVQDGSQQNDGHGVVQEAAGDQQDHHDQQLDDQRIRGE